MTGQCAGATERYGYSYLTDTWYRVTEWEELEGDKILATAKDEVDRAVVPRRVKEATDERVVDTGGDR